MKFFGSHEALMGLFHGEKLEEMGADGGAGSASSGDSSGDVSGTAEGAGAGGSDDASGSGAEGAESVWGLDDLFSADPLGRDQSADETDTLNNPEGSQETDETPTSGQGEETAEQVVQQEQEAGGETVEEMRARMAQMEQTIQTLQEAGQQQQNNQGQEQAPESGADAEVAAFNKIVEQYSNLTVPPELQNMLDSEDPQERNQGATALMRGAAIAAHNNMAKEMRTALTNLVKVLPQAVTEISQTSNAREQIKSDFYGKYPQYNVPGLEGMVLQVAQAVAKKRGDKQWNEGLRDAIHEELQLQMQNLMGQRQQQQPSASVGSDASGGYNPGNSARAPVQRQTTNPGNDAVEAFMSGFF